MVPSIAERSYWIPGSSPSLVFKKLRSFLRPLKNKGFQKEIMTKIGLYDLVKSTTLESNKSHFPLSAITDRFYACNQCKHIPWLKPSTE